MQNQMHRSDHDEPASLYFGKVMHARMKPREHRFTYKIFSLLIDLDRYSEVEKNCRLLKINRPGMVSFHEKDHGDRDGTPLRKHVNRLMREGGLPCPTKVLLWCNPSIFGYTFNPLSIYFCYDEFEKITALIYQVHNTFGESHSYIARIDENNESSPAAIKNSTRKSFYVSPFLDMNLRYDFRIQPPSELLRIRILEHDDDGPILSATFSGERSELNPKNLALGIFTTLGLTWKIVAGIHFEALRLWFKGVRLRSRPAPPKKPSYMHGTKNIVAGE